MNRSSTTRYFLGLIIIFTGIGILFNTLGIMHFHPGKLFPFLVLYFAVRLLERGKRIFGGILLLFGVLFFLDAWLSIRVGDIIGFVISIAIMYWGWQFIRSKKKEIEPPPASIPHATTQTHIETDPVPPHQSGSDYTMGFPKVKQSLIGNLFLTGNRWELKDMNIWHGIGEVKIDLSRALIHHGETVVMLNGWIGDIDIYVPYDLEISFIAQVNVGDIDVFGNKQGGLNRSVSLTTSNYQNAEKRVRIIVNLLVGDIDITYV
ncbi:cell wall-active antibiotics response protein LiaF [Ammoniphilus sp. 3BR4]|uniref:cell wall-active antibiotics response protein LiaF n=1 Tax=Ammoniphilus sp. 3BR4 TaxID=3158265 RepID=UPI00346746AF